MLGSEINQKSKPHRGKLQITDGLAIVDRMIRFRGLQLNEHHVFHYKIGAKSFIKFKIPVLDWYRHLTPNIESFVD